MGHGAPCCPNLPKAPAPYPGKAVGGATSGSFPGQGQAPGNQSIAGITLQGLFFPFYVPVKTWRGASRSLNDFLIVSGPPHVHGGVRRCGEICSRAPERCGRARPQFSPGAHPRNGSAHSLGGGGVNRLPFLWGGWERVASGWNARMRVGGGHRPRGACREHVSERWTTASVRSRAALDRGRSKSVFATKTPSCQFG